MIKKYNFNINERALKCKPSAKSQMCLFNVNACLSNENALLIIMYYWFIMVLELTCWNHVLISYNEMSNDMFVSSVVTRIINMRMIIMNILWRDDQQLL